MIANCSYLKYKTYFQVEKVRMKFLRIQSSQFLSFYSSDIILLSQVNTIYNLGCLKRNMKITRKKKEKRKGIKIVIRKKTKQFTWITLYIQVHTRSVVTLSIEYKECRFDIRKNKRESFIVRLQAPRG